MTTLQKATRHILTALHPECETWEDVKEILYIPCYWCRGVSVKCSHLNCNACKGTGITKGIPKISLAHVFQAFRMAEKHFRIHNNLPFGEEGFYNGKLVIHCENPDSLNFGWDLFKNAQSLNLSDQDESVWKAIVDIFES